MTVSAKMLEEALALPRQERVEFARVLLRSVEDDGDPIGETDGASVEELERRAQRISDGTAALTPWAEAKIAILGELRARRDAGNR